MKTENRTATTESLDALMPAMLKHSSTGLNTTPVHQQIIQAKQLPPQPLQPAELATVMVRVASMHGIKELPGDEILMLCMQSWQTKFSAHMNKHELTLAFELNVNGDLPQKVHHYQCFSREFFCDVLNQYLEKRKEANLILQRAQGARAELPPHKEQTAPNQCAQQYRNNALQAILADFKQLHGGQNILTAGTGAICSFNTRLLVLSKMTELDTGVGNITRLRSIAAQNIVRRLSARKQRLNPQTKFGAIASISNAIARIKSGKLLTQDDEDMIRAEVNELLYIEALCSFLPAEDEDLEKCLFWVVAKENMEHAQ